MILRGSKGALAAFAAIAIASQAYAQSLGGITFQWLRIEPGASATRFYGLFVNNNPTCKKVAFIVSVDGRPGFNQTMTISGNSSSTYNYTNDSGSTTQLIIGSVVDC
jgi:hypothetical protein